jgi:hypothetical protein
MIKNKKTLIHILIVFLFTLAVASLFSTLNADPHHDGIMLKPAVDVANGEILFKQTFTQYGALATFLQALALAVFGRYLIVIRLLTAFFYAIIATVIWMIWSRLIPQWLATITCVAWVLLAPYLFWTFLPWSSVYALFFQVLALHLLICYYEEHKLYIVIFAGVIIALCFWCRQPVGILLLGAIIFSLFIEKNLLKLDLKKLKAEIGCILLGFTFTSVIFFLYLFLTDSLRDWWIQNILYPLKWARLLTPSDMSPIKRILISLIPYTKAVKVEFLWTLVPVSLLLTGVIILGNHWIRKANLTQKSTVFILALPILMASWLQYYPVTDYRHIYWAFSPMLGFYAYILWMIGHAIIFHSLSQKSVSSTKQLVGISLITLFLLIITLQAAINWRVVAAWNRLQYTGTYIESPSILRWMRLNAQEGKSYEELTAAINSYFQKNPQSNLITNGQDALYLLLSDKAKNIHPLYINWGDVNTMMYENYNDVVSKYIEDNHPLIVGQDLPSGYQILQTVGKTSLFVSLNPVLSFIIIDHEANIDDIIGKFESTPDGMPDSKIEILFEHTVPSISSIIVEHRDRLNNITARWDTLSNYYWLAGVFRGDEAIVSKKKDNLQLVVEKGTKLWLRLDGDLGKIGDVEVIINYNDGTFSKQTLLIDSDKGL